MQHSQLTPETQTQSQSATAPRLLFTRFDSTNPPILAKKATLHEGKVKKSSSANMVAGTARQVGARDLHDFAALLDDLPSSAALAYGVAPEYPIARVVDKDTLAKLANREGIIARTRSFFSFRRAPGVLMLDFDPPKALGERPEQTHHLPPNPPSDLVGYSQGFDSDSVDAVAFDDGVVGFDPDNPPPAAAIRTVRLLLTAAPCLRDAPMLWRPSASFGLYAEGEEPRIEEDYGQRIYIPVADAALIPEAGKALVELLWAHGCGRFEIGKAGQLLERCPVDAAVWQPERLDFAAPPHLGAGVKRLPLASFVRGNPSGLFDLRELTGLVDGTVKARASAARKATRAAAQPAAAEVQAAWAESEAPRLAAERKITVDAARIVLARAVEKRELTGDFTLQAPDGSRVRVGELLDNPARWHGKRFADPLEPDYGHDGRIAWANLRSGGRPFIYSHAHGGRRFYLIRPSARIQVKKGDRARILDNILDLLRARGDLFDFGEGASLARVTESARALPVTRDWLSDHLDRIAEFYSVKVTVDEEGNTQNSDIPEDAPIWAAMRVMARDGERRLASLDAVITAPTLRRDGSILNEPGHDAASRLLLVSDTPDLPHIPERPTIDQARAALETLWNPIRLFPLVDEVDRGVVLAALLTACVRASLTTAPGFALDAPAAGTGKTLLAQAIAALGIGYAPPALPPASNQDEEARKRLFAALRDGHRVLLWDNVREPLGNGALDAFLTAPTFTDRILGKSETATLPNRALFIVTGNNLRMVGDTCRRILPARLDAAIEKPYAREFDFDPVQAMLSRRLELVTAALTIIRAWIALGRPRHGKGRTASFEGWDDLVRQPACWVATWDARFADPLIATERAFAVDPETAKLTALLAAWDSVVGTQPITVGELVTKIEHVSDYAPPEDATPALRDAIEEIAGDNRGNINRRILGRWIERHVDRRHHGLRLIRGAVRRGSLTWILVRDTPSAHKSPHRVAAVKVTV